MVFLIATIDDLILRFQISVINVTSVHKHILAEKGLTDCMNSWLEVLKYSSVRRKNYSLKCGQRNQLRLIEGRLNDFYYILKLQGLRQAGSSLQLGNGQKVNVQDD